MYLRDCFIENVGPIELLDVSLDMASSGNPKPVILVGKNGTGKTIFLAHVLDALAELAKVPFRDVVIGQRVGHQPFVKVTSGGDTRSLSGTSLSLLEFSSPTAKFNYLEKFGALDPADYATRLENRFEALRSWPKDTPFHKEAVGDSKKVQSFFQQSSVCFFPSSRHERPHWLNAESVEEKLIFQDIKRIEGILDKPLIIEQAAEQNQRWLMDVMLDSLVDADVFITDPNMAGWLPGHSLQPRPTQNLNDKMLLQTGRRNIEALLREVLEDEQANFVLNYRDAIYGRLAIRLGSGVTIPSLTHFSAGQALLFNLFATIIRYADRGSLMNSIRLNEIEGIILIDEIDMHLHADLQYEVLPRLIKLFPRVQFVVTSHAPLFLLGMEREFGPEGIEILEMPTGRRIGTERFAEFSRSLKYYRQTRAFEAEVERQVLNASKPLVLTEGQTDSIYIRTALKILGHTDLLEQLTIDEIGKAGKQGARGGGHTNLESAKKFLESNENHFQRGVLLLYDCDTKRKSEDLGRLFVRSIPANPEQTKALKGIENLIPPELFEERFYQNQEKQTDYGGTNIISEFLKTEFCNWICEQRQNPEDFKHFNTLLVPILRAFLESVNLGF